MSISAISALLNTTSTQQTQAAQTTQASSAAAAGKKTAISGAAGKSAAAHSRSKLRELLAMMQAEVLEEETGISLDMKAFQTDLLELTEEDEKQLAKQAEAFLQFLG